MLKRLTAILAAVLPMLCLAQTSISGVVNTYYKVTGVNTTQNTVTLSSVSGLATNDKVMIIQMKGASTGTNTNNSSFGTITALNGAGDYEINTVCSITGSNVYLVNTLSHSYSLTDKVQLVRIPTYTSAIVTDSLKAAAWDSTAGTGGVLAINVTNNLTLNAPISASGKGFAGGKFIMGNSACIDNASTLKVNDPTGQSFVFPVGNTQLGDYKGEGITDVSLSQRGGQAAIANGGGGGNNHNTGGGGGANAGAGGMGGNNSTTNGCKSDYPGLGGNSISSTSTKLFFGGGGGAGHGNNTIQSGGGAGGGIVYLQAGSLTSNGYTISANGVDGSNTIGDGASGGGAGGTVIMKVTTYTGNISITANGGNGGNVDNEGFTDRCFGQGGGGGGGKVYFTNATTPSGTATTTGGNKGIKTNSPGCASAGTATNGGAGNVTTGASVTQSITPSSSCAVQSPLPVHLISFQAVSRDHSVYLDWEVTGSEDAAQYIIQRRTTGGWSDVKTIPASATATYYQTIDGNLISGSYQYRLLIIEKTGAKVYSETRLVRLIESAVPSITLSPNPASKEVVIIGSPNGLLQIFDLAGRLLVEKTITASGSTRQDVSQWQAGMYIIKINGATEKLLIQRN